MPKPDKELLSIENYKYSIDLPTRFTDLNVGHHVSNTALIQIIEDARARFLLENGFVIAGDGVLMVINNQIDYVAECFWPAPVNIHIKVQNIGNTSFTLNQLVIQEGKVVVLSTLTMVNVKNARPSPLSEDGKAKLELFK